ncbi:penicillin-insensitive murein endopeptidase [Aureimonas populi]|uniref:Penicillin-insensitive murein endopeptidase n=1 Tax=Aureimonas populi TaxID=1701758 RepID=A0ABW5CPL1_9HYPH|nr:penicillin-insensitive murein endopeptidase [Aureimonas populi]
MGVRAARLILAACGLMALALPAQAQVAREVFGGLSQPAGATRDAIGTYAKGCLAGGVQMPADGPHWQDVRRSRNKSWGHPNTIAFLQRFSQAAAGNDNWRGLLLGDISQPRGGPAVGHASHQIGLDADVYLTEMPARRLTEEERETMDMPSLLRRSALTVDEAKWRPEHLRLIRRAALDREVDRIFVHPGIKKKLCETAGGDRSWLRKVRPTYGHDYHFHVRLSCPAGTSCEKQSPVPASEGCDASLQWWFDVALQPPPPDAPPYKPKPPMQLSELPRACVALARAPAGSAPALAQAGAAPALPPAATGFLPQSVPLPSPRPLP